MFLPRALQKKRPRPVEFADKCLPVKKSRTENLQSRASSSSLPLFEEVTESPPSASLEELTRSYLNKQSDSEHANASPEGQVQKANQGQRITPHSSSDYLERLACDIALIFTDYAFQDEKRLKWLQKHQRKIDTGDDWIHFSSILSHHSFANLEPVPTQPLLKHAMQKFPSAYLEVSPDGYYIRRRPSMYPLPFIPTNAMEIRDDSGVSFWDQRTIYVEPHTPRMSRKEGELARWLTRYGQLRAKMMPIQAVDDVSYGSAFIILSGSVMHENAWQQWRRHNKPENWIVMTKVEHQKRTEEYVALLKASGQDPKFKRRQTKREVQELGKLLDTSSIADRSTPFADWQTQESDHADHVFLTEQERNVSGS